MVEAEAEEGPALQAEDRTTPGALVGVVEDDPVYRARIARELERVPEVERVLAWESAEAFWRDRRGRQVQVLFLDVQLGGMDGVELVGKIAQRRPQTAVVMLSNLNSDRVVFQALRNGATGYLLKTELKDIGETLRTILGGGATITPTIALRVLMTFRESNPVLEAGLTDREKQILQLLARGKTIARVSDILGCSYHTVHHHARSIYRKLDVHNRSELAGKAASAGLLDD